MNILRLLFLFLWIPGLSGKDCIPQINRLLTESELRAKGFGDEEVAGMDAMDSYLGEVARWREMPSIDPKETHLSFLADLIDPHIKFIRQGILKMNRGDTRRKIEILKMFIVEAHERRESGRVSYRWWVHFNYRLSALISAETRNMDSVFYRETDWISDSGMEEYYGKRSSYSWYSDQPGLLGCFHKVALCPVKNGNLGYFTFNRTQTTRAYPLGLVNEDITVDGLRMNPNAFFEHDEHHAISSEDNIKRFEMENLLEKRMIPFHKAFLEKMDTLSLQERRDAEWIYFLLSHERPIMFWINKRQVSTKKELMKGLPDMKKNILHFMDIVHEIERDLGW